MKKPSNREHEIASHEVHKSTGSYCYMVYTSYYHHKPELTYSQRFFFRNKEYSNYSDPCLLRALNNSKNIMWSAPRFFYGDFPGFMLKPTLGEIGI